MRQLNAREKNLALLVLCSGLLVGGGQLRKMLDKQVNDLRGQLGRSQDQLAQSRVLLTKTATPSAPTPAAASPATGQGSRVTMTILKDVTSSREAERIRITKLERAGDASFHIIAEGRFAEMMRFIGMLERMEGRFTVAGGELARILQEAKPTPTPNAEPPETRREVRASLTLNMKGGGA